MSFFSKISKEMGGYYQGANSPAPQPQFGTHPQYGTPPPAGPYGAPQQYGMSQQYGAPPGAPQYNSPPPQQVYNAPPPQALNSSPPAPQLPHGWTPLWDPHGQRWAYLELSNSKVIWTIPTAPSLGQPDNYDASRGFGDSSGHAPQGYGGQYGAPGEVKDKDDKTKMMMGAAGGLALGAVGGMVLANALDDDEQHAGGGAYGGGGYQQQQQYPPMTGDLPDETASGSSVSSSDKEDVEEAREAYEEAYEETYGSD